MVGNHEWVTSSVRNTTHPKCVGLSSREKLQEPEITGKITLHPQHPPCSQNVEHIPRHRAVVFAAHHERPHMQGLGKERKLQSFLPPSIMRAGPDVRVFKLL